MIKRLVMAALTVIIAGTPVPARAQTQPDGGFLVTQFAAEDGLPGHAIMDAAQTPDGFLWLVVYPGTLVRFDGKSFHAFDDTAARHVAVAADGDLWVGTRDTLTRVPASSFNQARLSGLTTYDPGPPVNVIKITSRGELLVGTEDGLFRYERDRFVAVLPRTWIRAIAEAPNGTLLVTTTTGFIELSGAEVVRHPRLAERLGVTDDLIFQVVRDRQGDTWYSSADGLPFLARETSGRIDRLRTSALTVRLHLDAQGTVWIGQEGGLFRATAAGLEQVITGINVLSLNGDREGNLWVGSNGDGLFRVTPRRVRVFTTKDGLPNDDILTVLTAHDGALWAGASCVGLVRFDGTRFQTYGRKHGLTNSCVRALAEDADGALWIGTQGGGAFRFHHGTFTQYSVAQGMASDVVTSVAAARDGTVWFATRGGVSRLRGGHIRTIWVADARKNEFVTRIFEDPSGGLWFGTVTKGLYRITDDRVENVPDVPTRYARPMGHDRRGGLYLSSGVEVLRLANGRVETIKGLSGSWEVAETAQGELWFGGLGFYRVHPGAFEESLSRDTPLDHEPFARSDGLTTSHITGGDGPVLALSPDGTLWAATGRGLVQFDRGRLPVTRAKPTIYLKGVTIGRETRPADGKIVLAPGTSHVEIGFAAVEISSPEKIRLQYRLDGVDSEWLDAPPDPRAVYSHLPVGTHTLRIRASNRNGIWDRQGVLFSVTQLPHFYQTAWFAAAMITLGVLLVIGIYRLRVRQISRAMSARFEERLGERTRVARELHDTFLQTVHGSRLVVEHALKDPADHDRMTQAMQQVFVWLGQATEEGRAALNSLRASTVETNNLADALRRVVVECRQRSHAEISLEIKGDAREMHPVVRDEVYRIAYEAIRNACTHSGGDRLGVLLEYSADLTLRVSDNGVGIDPDVMEKGRESHFGLRGMRERAERIGGRIAIVTAPGSGTVITLVVPGPTVFRAGRKNRA